MIEERVPLTLPPGFFQNGTRHQALGRWVEGNFIRFLDGTIRPLGGWSRMTDGAGTQLSALTGKPRAAYALRDAADSLRLTIGTHSHAYNVTAGVVTDITPAAFVVGAQNGNTIIGVTATAYGAGLYGAGLYGGGVTSVSEYTPPDTWSLDGWGNNTLGVFTADGRLLESIAGAQFAVVANAPTGNRAVFTTPERFAVVLGPGGVSRRVQWSDQEDNTLWTPAIDNQAGDFDLTTEGVVVCGRRTRRQSLIFTSSDVWSMTYVGGTLIYSFDKVGDACGIVSPQAVACAGSKAFWMSRNNFWVFDGWAQPIPSEVRDYVFSDFNAREAPKVQAVTNSDFDEITWFYPSAQSLENDRYVTYNYRENHWVTGQIARGAAVDRGALVYPVWVGTDGLLWEHELGGYHDSPATLSSGPIPLGTGDQVYRVQKFIPDERTLGDVVLQISTRFEPMGNATSYGLFTMSESVDVRMTGRFVEFEFIERRTDWRIGTMTAGVRPQGRR